MLPETRGRRVSKPAGAVSESFQRRLQQTARARHATAPTAGGAESTVKAPFSCTVYRSISAVTGTDPHQVKTSSGHSIRRKGLWTTHARSLQSAKSGSCFGCPREGLFQIHFVVHIYSESSAAVSAQLSSSMPSGQNGVQSLLQSLKA